MQYAECNVAHNAPGARWQHHRSRGCAAARLHLAEQAAAAADGQQATRLLYGVSAPPSGPEDSTAASPLRLLTDLRAAALRAQLPAAIVAGAADDNDMLQGSGRAPGHASQLCRLLNDIVVPFGDRSASSSSGLASVDTLLRGAGADVALQPVIARMPTAVRDAAARGCLLLARWAQVKTQNFMAWLQGPTVLRLWGVLHIMYECVSCMHSVASPCPQNLCVYTATGSCGGAAGGVQPGG